jgi:1,4-dihydroxy-2-naphthoate octaprenyltransferase
MSTWRVKLKGMFMLFRILAVMVWACTAATVATAAAGLNGAEIDWPVFGFVVLMGALVQGYPAHIINEIYDWQSGSDQPFAPSTGRGTTSKKPVTGGSKVIAAGLLSIGDLWRLFHITTAAVVLLTVFIGMAYSAKLLWFIIPGYFLCIFYTLPPFRFAYRPFLGEYCGGFAGIILLVCGAYFAQTLLLPFSVILLALGLGFLYAAVMVFFHYVDFSRDRLASPPKRTSVVHLGLAGSRRYALANAAVGAGSLFYLAITAAPPYFLLVIIGALIFYCHYRVRPDDDRSIVYWGKRMTYGILVIGVLFGMVVDVAFIGMAAFYVFGYWLHKNFGKLHTTTAASRA